MNDVACVLQNLASALYFPLQMAAAARQSIRMGDVRDVGTLAKNKLSTKGLANRPCLPYSLTVGSKGAH